ncbi:MAG: ABC transporter permease [Pyrinomonadaceae bacterium]|nr:ABC transporter permease [Pyrinomonadaceae bacterium]
MKSFFNIFISALVPKKLRFEFQLALRHLLSGGWQTILTISAVAAGVIIVIFITSLIFGLQEMMSDLLTESIPHVVVQVEDPKPKTLTNTENPTSSRIEEQASQLKFIDNWEQVVRTIRGLPNVRGVSPVVSGQGFASKGANPVGVSVVGAEPELLDVITPITKDLTSGKYRGLGSDEIVIDAELAKDLNTQVGERIRLTSSSGQSDSFTIAGIYSRGQGRGSAYVTLRNGQSLFGFGTSVNVIYVKVYNIYDVENLSNTIMALTPYEAKPWTIDFSRFLVNMQMMGASAYLISIFSLIASAFAIASVLVVSVLQKSSQIGILKSMGARQRQILTVFIFEGLGVAIMGSSLGAVIGMMIVHFIGLLERPDSTGTGASNAMFPVRILPLYIGLAILAAIITTVIAAVLPARQAAKLNPVDVMR